MSKVIAKVNNYNWHKNMMISSSYMKGWCKDYYISNARVKFTYKERNKP